VPLIAADASSAEPGYGRRWRYLPFASPRLASLDVMPFPAPTTVPTFLWVGALDERKQPEMFVRALASVASSGRSVRGIIAGSGPRSAEIERLVTATGAPIRLVGHADPAPLLVDAWATVLFSRTEGTPLSIEEAMWVGRAVIASDLPGIAHLVGTTGALATTEAEAVAAVEMFCDNAHARAAGAAASARIRAVIDVDAPWPELAHRYESRLFTGRQR
jgi:glycosyltransferase involved in cell wall biosynthesis